MAELAREYEVGEATIWRALSAGPFVAVGATCKGQDMKRAATMSTRFETLTAAFARRLDDRLQSRNHCEDCEAP